MLCSVVTILFVLSSMPLPYHVIHLLVMFGSSFVRDYSRVEFSLVRLRDKRYIYVLGFDCFSLHHE